MPIAICNTCSEIVKWFARPGATIRHQKCSCGSQDLTSVRVEINYNNNTYEYYDRGNNLVKTVPRDVPRYTTT